MKKSEKARKEQVPDMLSKQKIRSVCDIESYKLQFAIPIRPGLI